MADVDSYIVIKSLEKSFGNQMIFENVDLRLAKGQCLSVLGPSGHGKSTFLHCIAGLEMVNSGEIIVRGEDRTDAPIGKRNIIYLQQKPLLFPNMTVRQNVAYGLKARKEDKASIHQKVDRWMDIIGLEDHAKKYPDQLSGGQQQRVGLARALILEPDVVLLDEPFHALDQILKQKLYAEVMGIIKEQNITCILVTHDVREALLFGDKFAWMENTQLELFTDRNAFIGDDRSGVNELISFWKELDDE